MALLRGYASNPTEVRVVTVNSVPFLIITAPYALEVCGLPLCLGINDVWNYTSLSPAAVPPTPAGYNDVTGLGVPWVPKLLMTRIELQRAQARESIHRGVPCASGGRPFCWPCG